VAGPVESICRTRPDGICSHKRCVERTSRYFLAAAAENYWVRANNDKAQRPRRKRCRSSAGSGLARNSIQSVALNRDIRLRSLYIMPAPKPKNELREVGRVRGDVGNVSIDCGESAAFLVPHKTKTPD
jgi:hypothetical protein